MRFQQQSSLSQKESFSQISLTNQLKRFKAANYKLNHEARWSCFVSCSFVCTAWNLSNAARLVRNFSYTYQQQLKKVAAFIFNFSERDETGEWYSFNEDCFADCPKGYRMLDRMDRFCCCVPPKTAETGSD